MVMDDYTGYRAKTKTLFIMNRQLRQPFLSREKAKVFSPPYKKEKYMFWLYNSLATNDGKLLSTPWESIEVTTFVFSEMTISPSIHGQ